MSAPKYVRITSAMTVLPEGESVFSEMSTKIEIDDEAGGAFLVVSQVWGAGNGSIRLTSEEWPAVRGAIEAMFAEIGKMERTPESPAEEEKCGGCEKTSHVAKK